MLKPLIFATTALLATNIAMADTKPVVHKTYSIEELKRVVTNSPSCHLIFDSLKELASRHVRLSFTPTGKTGSFTMTDLRGVMKNSTFTILKEKSNSHSINRVGMGSFELDHQKIDYVIQVGVDLNKPAKDYLYPMILSGDTRLCYYSALLKPNENTTMRFKRNILAGKVKQGNDLTQ